MNPALQKHKHPAILAIHGIPINQDLMFLFILTTNGKTLQTTATHPFYIVDHSTTVGHVRPSQWIEAKDLKPGDQSALSNDQRLTIASVTTETRNETVYNFQVDNAHTYFVGEDGVLVHNADKAYTVAINSGKFSYKGTFCKDCKEGEESPAGEKAKKLVAMFNNKEIDLKTMKEGLRNISETINDNRNTKLSTFDDVINGFTKFVTDAGASEMAKNELNQIDPSKQQALFMKIKSDILSGKNVFGDDTTNDLFVKEMDARSNSGKLPTAKETCILNDYFMMVNNTRVQNGYKDISYEEFYIRGIQSGSIILKPDTEKEKYVTRSNSVYITSKPTLVSNSTPDGMDFKIKNSKEDPKFFKDFSALTFFHGRRDDGGHSIGIINNRIIDTYHLFSESNNGKNPLLTNSYIQRSSNNKGQPTGKPSEKKFLYFEAIDARRK